MRRIAVSAVIVVLGVVGMRAQEPKPAFEVASVRRNVSDSALPTQGTHPGGRFVATNQPLVRLIAFAYKVDDFRLVGGPDWIRDARFDINAKAPSDASIDQIRVMMQSLLERRFKLITYREQRDMSIYSLVPARDDGRLGPGLRRVDDCKDVKPPSLPGGNRYYGCGPISVAAAIASMTLGAPVEDETGIQGMFAVVINFSPEGVRPFPGHDVPPGDFSSQNSDLPSFRDALREQLGLKLESIRGPVEVLVVDSVEQPTEN